MRTSLKERIISSLFLGVFLFIIYCVIYKLFDYRSDWLSISVIWSVAWAIGNFVAKSLNNLEENLWKTIGMELLIILVTFILLAFILGVVCDMANWADIVTRITVSFGVSLLINNNWKKRD